MGVRRQVLTKGEIARPFESPGPDARFGPVLSVGGLAELLGLSPKTVYEWAAKGRLDGTYRKRGKHLLFWRDKALDVIFNGPDWSDRP